METPVSADKAYPTNVGDDARAFVAPYLAPLRGVHSHQRHNLRKEVIVETSRFTYRSQNYPGLSCLDRDRPMISAQRSTSTNSGSALYCDGIPLVVDQFVSDTDTKGSSGAVCSSVSRQVRPGVGLMGVEHDSIQVECVGELETKDAARHPIK
jgi:hypothetical protein